MEVAGCHPADANNKPQRVTLLDKMEPQEHKTCGHVILHDLAAHRSRVYWGTIPNHMGNGLGGPL